MAYALVRPRAATVAGARGSCESGGVDVCDGPMVPPWRPSGRRHPPSVGPRVRGKTFSARAHLAVLAASASGRTLRHRMVGTPGAPVSAHSLTVLL